MVDRGTGHVASAKHPRLWERLLACRAAFAEPPRPGAPPPPVLVTLLDGSAVRSDDAGIDRVLSRLLGREVTLTAHAPPAATREADRSPPDAAAGADVRVEPMALAAPAGTFFDVAALHLLTTATLERLGALCPEGRFDSRRFRPNVVVASPAEADDFVEQGWVTHALALGADLRLRVIDSAPRCVVTTLAQGGLPRDPGILRALARHTSAPSATLAPGTVFPAVAGVYATVLRDGAVRRGDAVAVEAAG